MVLAGPCSSREVLRRCRRLLASVGSACHETVGETTGGSGSLEGCLGLPETPGDGKGAPRDGQGAPGDDQGAPGEGQGAPGDGQGAPGDGQGAQGAGRVPGGTERGTGGLSRVLLRSGVTPEYARRTLRLSLGRGTTEDDVMEAVEDLRQALLETKGEERKETQDL